MNEYWKFVMFGLMSGLLVGGVADLIIDWYNVLWLVFVIIGVQQGIIMAERNRFKKLKQGGKK